MGLQEKRYDVWERPKLATYQWNVGLEQFKRSDNMIMKRRVYSKIINEELKNIPGITIFSEQEEIFWNYQYHIVRIDKHMKDVFHCMFKKGIHLMQEDVWDCTKFDFPLPQNSYPIGANANPCLIRIPNNSRYE